MVEMKSPRNWALQPYRNLIFEIYKIYAVEKKSPRNWALQPLLTALHLPMFLRRKEKLEVV